MGCRWRSHLDRVIVMGSNIQKTIGGVLESGKRNTNGFVEEIGLNFDRVLAAELMKDTRHWNFATMERLPRFAICSPAVRNNAAMKDEILEAIIPHSDFGDWNVAAAFMA